VYELIKSVTVFRKIDDIEAFERFYTKVVFPRLHKMPGVLYTDVTRIAVLSEEKMSPDLKGIEFIVETYFESYESMQLIFSTPEGLEMMQIIEDYSPGEFSVFIGNKKRILADWYKANRRKMELLEYKFTE
jgi:hypothetical protein